MHDAGCFRIPRPSGYRMTSNHRASTARCWALPSLRRPCVNAALLTPKPFTPVSPDRRPRSSLLRSLIRGPARNRPPRGSRQGSGGPLGRPRDGLGLPARSGGARWEPDGNHRFVDDHRFLVEVTVANLSPFTWSIINAGCEGVGWGDTEQRSDMRWYTSAMASIVQPMSTVSASRQRAVCAHHRRPCPGPRPAAACPRPQRQGRQGPGRAAAHLAAQAAEGVPRLDVKRRLRDGRRRPAATRPDRQPDDPLGHLEALDGRDGPRRRRAPPSAIQSAYHSAHGLPRHQGPASRPAPPGPLQGHDHGDLRRRAGRGRGCRTGRRLALPAATERLICCRQERTRGGNGAAVCG